MKNTLVVIAALILGGCATVRPGAEIGSGPDRPVADSAPRAEQPATLLGRDGETAAHLYARLIARNCAGDETEHVVAQVEYFLEACANDGQRECELAACDRLRHAMPPRCSDSVAAR